METNSLARGLLLEIKNLDKIESMDNLRLVWEFYFVSGLSDAPIGSYKEKVMLEALKRLAPISEEYDWQIWGWKTNNNSKDNIVYKLEVE